MSSEIRSNKGHSDVLKLGGVDPTRMNQSPVRWPLNQLDFPLTPPLLSGPSQKEDNGTDNLPGPHQQDKPTKEA